MLIDPVAGVNDRGMADAGYEVRNAAQPVPYDDVVDTVGLYRSDRVQKGFPLDHAARGHRKVDHVGAQPLFREFEGNPGPRRWLKEEVDHRLTPESRDLLDVPLEDILEGRGGIEDLLDLLFRDIPDADQVSHVFARIISGRLFPLSPG